jgi:hypothetical protein
MALQREQDKLAHRTMRDEQLMHQPELAYERREQDSFQHRFRRATQRVEIQSTTASLAPSTVPNNVLLKQFEQSAIAAQLLFAKGSGSMHITIFSQAHP